MTYQTISWHGGTQPRRSIQDRDDREQSDEPPAEYWDVETTNDNDKSTDEGDNR